MVGLPESSDFISLLGFDLVAEDAEITAYRYAVGEILLEVSFDIIRGSSQTTLAISGESVQTTSCEGLVSVEISQDASGCQLRAKHNSKDSRVNLEISTDPFAINWNQLLSS